MQQLVGLAQGIQRKRDPAPTRQFVPTCVWQTDPPLPAHVTFDLSNHIPKLLPAPNGWEIQLRNARVIITDPSSHTFGIDGAQYGMLLGLQEQSRDGTAKGFLNMPTEQFLSELRSVCRFQRRSDAAFGVPWNRHLIACIQHLTQAGLLIGPSTAIHNPHFRFLESPTSDQTGLGEDRIWPDVKALLLLDSIAPEHRAAWLQRAAQHRQPVWILRMHHPSRAALTDLRKLADLRAQCVALVPAKSNILHKPGGWQRAEWDEQQSTYPAQIWLLDPRVSGFSTSAHSSVLTSTTLGDWSGRRYDFHQDGEQIPEALFLYRKHQQDALQYTFQGLVCATDGSANIRTEEMGAGFAIGHGRDPLLTFSAPVGGVYSPLRAEAVSLLKYLQTVRERFPEQKSLLIFIDCLVLLTILKNRGHSEFQPVPRDIVHFDVLLPLLAELRSWTGTIFLVKVKSHAGCRLNEIADELADLGLKSREEQLFPGPAKYGTLWLRIRKSWRQRVMEENFSQRLPRDHAPNKSILACVSDINCSRAIRKRSTQFVRHLFRRPEGLVISRNVAHCADAIWRVWTKTMTGIYPVQLYLHRIGKAKSPHCPYCGTAELETLTHFACVCPQFREARTEAHNQLRTVLVSHLRRALPTDWQLLEETPLAKSGLRMAQFVATEVQSAQDGLDPLPDEQNTLDLGRWQPDFILISQERARIAILEVTRPADMLTAQLVTAYNAKKSKYAPILPALQHYTDRGWSVEILPWVIGIRGLTDTGHLHQALQYLDIPKQRWPLIIADSALASVRGLAYMHGIRYSASRPGSTGESEDLPPIAARRSKTRPSHSTEHVAATRQRWTNLLLNVRRTSRHGTRSNSTPSKSSPRITCYKKNDRKDTIGSSARVQAVNRDRSEIDWTARQRIAREGTNMHVGWTKNKRCRQHK